MNFLGQSQDFNIPQGLALTGKAFFLWLDGWLTRCESPIKKPPWAQTRAVFSYGRKGFTLWQQVLLCAVATFL